VARPKAVERSQAGSRGSEKKAAAKAGSKNQSLTLTAYETLKEKIIVGFFLPGQYLNEAAISNQLGYGRTPVHQALQRLQLEGLVEVVPRKGVIIQPDSAGQIIEILNARIVVESELVRGAAKHATKDTLQDLERILLNERRSSAGASIDLFIEKDRAFHAKIAAISGNAVLGDFARTLHERSIRYLLLTMWQTFDAVATERQHRAILRAIRKHNPMAASKAMRAHLMSLRSRLTQLQRSKRLKP
jgi:GntR family transcriptional regulator, rspAB operon transcriptional repressor